MISKFGTFLRIERIKHNDTLKTLSEKLNISVAYLSAMEVGRRVVPIELIEKIRELYNLNDKEYDELYAVTIDSNNKVDLELSKMNEAQREVTMIFARKINNADDKLLEKLKKALEEER